MSINLSQAIEIKDNFLIYLITYEHDGFCHHYMPKNKIYYIQFVSFLF